MTNTKRPPTKEECLANLNAIKQEMARLQKAAALWHRECMLADAEEKTKEILGKYK